MSFFEGIVSVILVFFSFMALIFAAPMSKKERVFCVVMNTLVAALFLLSYF